ncbi:MAG: transcription termination factor NusA [Lachnospiraceae bacterium]|nr:transcription termination factor NusA [Lachnospiraceae bacterium]
MNELLEALTILEKEKDISKDVLLDAIENSLIQACKSHFGRADNIKVFMNRETCEYSLYAEKEVVETVEDPLMQISLEDARKLNSQNYIGDTAYVPVKSKDFGRISTQIAKNVILQKIREEERKVLFDQYYAMEKEVVTGIIQRTVGNNISVNIGKCDALLPENEQVRTEHFEPTQRIKVYILEVKSTSKGPRIQVSRTHPELVKRLFEMQVAEVKEGIVEIKGIAREAGSRTKMAVWSNDPNVDAVGACVGVNGERVNAVVRELCGEKVDIINWNENPAILIENALNPAQVICVIADEEEKTAQVIVPDNQLSLAIGKVGQNARLAAKLTGYKIDIKSETEARESGLFDEIEGLDREDEYIGYQETEEPDGETDISDEDTVSDTEEVSDFAEDNGEV